ETISLPRVTKDDILKCSFSQWYPLFRAHTIRSKIIQPIPQDLLDYLHQDGILLPNSAKETNSKGPEENRDSQTELDTDPDSDSTAEESGPELEAVTEIITKAIEELGGAVFPKLNWSSPKDAVWITATNTLKCTSADEIFILLKSSDLITNDLLRPFRAVTHDTDPRISQQPLTPAISELVLRKWSNLNPALEFRCFVVDQQIRAISQLDLNHYGYLAGDEPKIRVLIHTFFQTVVQTTFPGRHYAVDVYVQSDLTRVFIIDFNPLSTDTDTVLVTWDDILDTEPPATETAVASVEIVLFPAEADGIRFSSSRYSQNRFPVDL
ncbi:D123-domain-containing protein, partial [Dimargaris cristalligena]